MTKARLLTDQDPIPYLSHCIFDLEGTLFWSPAFKRASALQAARCVADLYKITVDAAKELIQETRSNLSSLLGYMPAQSTALCELGVNYQVWANYQSRIPVSEVIAQDLTLQGSIAPLASKLSLLIYTNMTPALAQRVLEYLQIKDCFNNLFTPLDFDIVKPKPNPAAIRFLIQSKTIEVEATLSVGDRYEIDIVSLVREGGYGYLVQSRSELGTLLDNIKKGL